MVFIGKRVVGATLLASAAVVMSACGPDGGSAGSANNAPSPQAIAPSSAAMSTDTSAPEPAKPPAKSKPAPGTKAPSGGSGGVASAPPCQPGSIVTQPGFHSQEDPSTGKSSGTISVSTSGPTCTLAGDPAPVVSGVPFTVKPSMDLGGGQTVVLTQNGTASFQLQWDQPDHGDTNCGAPTAVDFGVDPSNVNRVTAPANTDDAGANMSICDGYVLHYSGWQAG